MFNALPPFSICILSAFGKLSHHTYEWEIMHGSRRNLAHLIGGCTYTLIAMPPKVHEDYHVLSNFFYNSSRKR